MITPLSGHDYTSQVVIITPPGGHDYTFRWSLLHLQVVMITPPGGHGYN